MHGFAVFSLGFNKTAIVSVLLTPIIGDCMYEHGSASFLTYIISINRIDWKQYSKYTNLHLSKSQYYCGIVNRTGGNFSPLFQQNEQSPLSSATLDASCQKRLPGDADGEKLRNSLHQGFPHRDWQYSVSDRIRQGHAPHGGVAGRCLRFKILKQPKRDQSASRALRYSFRRL